ncbi:MAG: ribonuclease HI family protein, partial [Candidatus Neomarinimicrobiota bacterium]
EFHSFSENIGAATNNEAEYQALIRALDISKKLNIYKIDIFSDSELLVKQINLEYKVKNERLKKLHTKARDKLYNSTWKLSHIRREKNRKADFLSKKGLDEGPKK